MKKDLILNMQLEALASYLLFTPGVKTPQDIEEKTKSMSIEFRKGKSFSDIAHAIRKMHKQKMFKVEFELSMLAVYLRDVFKVAATQKPAVTSAAQSSTP